MTLGIIGTGGHAKSLYDIVKKKLKFIFLIKVKIFHVGNKKYTVISDIEIIKSKKKKFQNLLLQLEIII